MVQDVELVSQTKRGESGGGGGGGADREHRSRQTFFLCRCHVIYVM